MSFWNGIVRAVDDALFDFSRWLNIYFSIRLNVSFLKRFIIGALLYFMIAVMLYFFKDYNIIILAIILSIAITFLEWVLHKVFGIVKRERRVI